MKGLKLTTVFFAAGISLIWSAFIIAGLIFASSKGEGAILVNGFLVILASTIIYSSVITSENNSWKLIGMVLSFSALVSLGIFLTILWNWRAH